VELQNKGLNFTLYFPVLRKQVYLTKWSSLWRSNSNTSKMEISFDFSHFTAKYFWTEVQQTRLHVPETWRNETGPVRTCPNWTTHRVHSAE